MKNTGKYVVGIVLILLGVGILLDRLGIFIFWGFSLGRILAKFWPLILVFLGIRQLAKLKLFSGLLLLALGASTQIAILLERDVWDLLWPFLLIVFGVSILLKDKDRSDGAEHCKTCAGHTDVSSEDMIDEKANFAEIKKQVTSKNFKGGKIECSFAAVKLDLSEAKIEGKEAEIEINCSFGGVEIKVPKDVKIESRGSAFLGGWENKASTVSNEDAPVLRIKGSVSFGGVEITN